MAQFFADPTGLLMGIVNEELFWGDAGLGLSIFGSSAPAPSTFRRRPRRIRRRGVCGNTAAVPPATCARSWPTSLRLPPIERVGPRTLAWRCPHESFVRTVGCRERS